MGHKPTLQDLQDVHPTIHASLQKLLAQDNASQLGLVFQVHFPKLLMVYLQQLMQSSCA